MKNLITKININSALLQVNQRNAVLDKYVQTYTPFKATTWKVTKLTSLCHFISFHRSPVGIAEKSVVCPEFFRILYENNGGISIRSSNWLWEKVSILYNIFDHTKAGRPIYEQWPIHSNHHYQPIIEPKSPHWAMTLEWNCWQYAVSFIPYCVFFKPLTLHAMRWHLVTYCRSLIAHFLASKEKQDLNPRLIRYY